MTKFFDDPKKLFQYIQQNVMETLNDEVAEGVKDKQAEHVKKDVYDAYASQDPYVKRRNGNDGLADPANMIHTVTSTVNGLELFVKNIAKGNPNVYGTAPVEPPNYLAGIIEYGRLPDRNGRYTTNKTGSQDEYLSPRPFISNTIEELRSSLEYVDWLRSGMRKRGFDVE
ncbi:hypothetical protein [Halobacillus litoralis]|uniref:hypothetical protein n=1 Tax=Halobacillus litoralis TaxID=45668 RepID=UPI001CD4C603|nr:hypothetical protein [Halobacillus litoralis]MCA1021651.1 hypothetical protein [Halobacillus litoralis]